jgi:selenocysteine-specific translation elongation factor
MPATFRMLVENVWSLPNGPAVSGRIESGMVRLGDSLILDGAHGKFPVKVIFIQEFQRTLTEAGARPEPVALTLSGVEADQIKNRDLLLSEPAEI